VGVKSAQFVVGRYGKSGGVLVFGLGYQRLRKSSAWVNGQCRRHGRQEAEALPRRAYERELLFPQTELGTSQAWV
jgi:hypothetical protein